ncbi:hypothetical protein CYFUS_005007 [Cystobacter fuscus]|uniref:Uncharacterized protein n=1 Tax=Cystobacter fuscus TaxID=43 RepID=A0A250J7H5_9BACT|nr:hypothetical protein [Cystobacter fuscus]ATB39563.1 hypothetical protein CYFUS_005007 [Cystobacter fuscus]
MRRFFKPVVVMSAVFVLGSQSGCRGSDENLEEGLTPEQLQARWTSEHAGRPVGHAASFELSGSPLILTTEGTARVDAPSTLVTGASFPDKKYYVFFSEAQVGAQTGLLLLEGERISVTAGTLGAVALSKATARTHREDGSAAPAVELKTRMDSNVSDPQVTFPEDWSLAQKALFFSDPVAIQPSGLSLSGFTRGVLVTASGSTAISGSVKVDSAKHMYWYTTSFIENQASVIESPRFALGGAPQAGALASSELSPPPPLPGGLVGVQGRVLLQPGSARSEGSFQLTQAMTDSGLLVPAEVQVAFDEKKVLKVPQHGRELLTVVYREKTMRGDAVLADLQVTGGGKEAVRVAIDEPETLVGELWDAVGDAGIAGPVLAIPIAIVTPFVAIGEWISCLFSTCPVAYPLWMKAGTVSRFHVIVQGDLPPGTYDAEVTLTGRNYPAITIPVHFTIE